MKLGKLVFGKIVKAEPHHSVLKAAQQMNKQNVGSVVVQSRGKVLGIVTDRDIVEWLADGGADAAKTHVGEIMTKLPLVASVSDELEPTVDKMAKKGVHRVPIVDKKGNVAGVLSIDNVMALVARYSADLAEIMTHAAHHGKKGAR